MSSELQTQHALHHETELQLHDSRARAREWQVTAAQQRVRLDGMDTDLAGARWDLRRAQGSWQRRECLIIELTEAESRLRSEVVHESAQLSQCEAAYSGLRGRASALEHANMRLEADVRGLQALVQGPSRSPTPAPTAASSVPATHASVPAMYHLGTPSSFESADPLLTAGSAPPPCPGCPPRPLRMRLPAPCPNRGGHLSHRLAFVCPPLLASRRHVCHPMRR